jgi:DNA-binding CsgD family transcriptional regulator
MDCRSDLPWPDIHEFLLEVGAASSLTDLLSRTIGSIDHLVRFDICAVGVVREPIGVKIPSECLCPVSVGEQSERWARSFNEHYRHVMPDRSIHKGTTSQDWAECEQGEYVTDFLRPQRIAYSLALNPVNDHGSPQFGFALHRSKSEKVFGEGSVAILDAIHPHLINYGVMLLRSAREPESLPGADDIRSACARLTRREAEVAALLYRRYDTCLISSRLLISPRTVSKHIENIYEKTGVRSRRQLAAFLDTAI